MIQIDDVLVSLDVFKEKFSCDLDACKGQCCVEGDAGAPVDDAEVMDLENAVPVVWDQLSVLAQAVIKEQGVTYRDCDGDLVTSIVNGKDCVFTCYDQSGICSCALEQAYRAGDLAFCKPISCALYPIRVVEHPHFKAVNYHRWDVCKMAILKGQKENMAVYQFLKEPLVRKFGRAWYDELLQAASELKRNQYI